MKAGTALQELRHVDLVACELKWNTKVLSKMTEKLLSRPIESVRYKGGKSESLMQSVNTFCRDPAMNFSCLMCISMAMVAWEMRL